MIVIIFSLVSLFGWAIGDIFTTIASRKLGSFNASFYGYAFSLFIVLYAPFALDSWKYFDMKMILLTSFLTILQTLGFLAYNEGLKLGNSSLVGTIAGAFTSIVVILSIMFLGESLSTKQLISIIIIFVGLFLSSINISDLKNKKSIINKGTALAFFSMICWAIYFTFIKYLFKKLDFSGQHY